MDWLNKIAKKSSDIVDRSLDRNVRVAVTGLSRSGKTAFITSFINQLLHAPLTSQLTFFQADSENRLRGSKLSQHNELHIPGFDYSGAIKRLTNETAKWPLSTNGVSQAQLKCRFNVKHSWLKKIQAQSTVTIDIVDYPGEWLLDLPLLHMSFKDWSKACRDYLKSERRQEYTQKIASTISNQNYQSQHQDEVELSESVARLSTEYKAALLDYRADYNDYGLALPGRFIMPGELKGAPTLDFFPVLNDDVLSLDWEQFEENSLLRTLEKRFDYYKDNVIKPFFNEYFSRVDRQIVLIDTCTVLESGYEAYQDLKLTIEKLLEGFSYGRAHWLKRLFAPSIDKLMIASTKADLVPPDQHAALESFMQKMVAQAKNNVGYEGVEVETMAISAIATSEAVATEHAGKKLLCVKGKEERTGESVLHYPGIVPDKPLSRQHWDELEIDFSAFALPDLTPDEPLPQIRMDKVIQFLLGDKFL